MNQSVLRRPAAIVDMDGTLVDVASVRHHVAFKPKNFDKFHSESRGCPPHQLALDFCREQTAKGRVILVVTARMEMWRAISTAWLHEHMPCHFEGPFMRADRDYRADNLIKREIHAHLSHHWDIKAACDDNPRIIDLWAELGIPTTIVPGWELEGIDIKESQA